MVDKRKWCDLHWGQLVNAVRNIESGLGKKQKPVVISESHQATLCVHGMGAAESWAVEEKKSQLQWCGDEDLVDEDVWDNATTSWDT